MQYKIFITVFLIISVAYSSDAQQDNLSTHFMFNKLNVNPAFAGNDDAASITAIIRDQWTGLEGSPKTQSLSINFPKLGKVGLGININRQTVGVSEKISLEGIYAFRFKVKSGILSMGMSFSGRYFKQDFADPHLFLINSFTEDQAIQEGIYSTRLFNVGFGIYYSDNRYYLGASIPRLIKSDIDYVIGDKKSTEVRHLYLMTGGAIDINPKLVFMPQVKLRWAENSPYNLDLNGGFLFYDKLYLATTVRAGGAFENWFESVDFLLGLHITNNVFMATSYDVTLSPLRKYENGSLEILLQYKFGNKIKPIDIINPRFF